MSPTQKQNVLMTGGTGFVGKAVLARLVDQPAYDKIYLLIRPKAKSNPQERMRVIVQAMFPPHRHEQLLKRLIALPGDLTAPGLGLGEDTVAALAKDIHQILHVGASTDFGAPLDEARRDNVEGTRYVLDLAVQLKTQGVFRRFDYVSTAYVAGLGKGAVSEQDLDRGQAFANNYERSKLEAEVLARTYKDKFTVVVHRPSIVVGDSVSGYTPHFKVLYWPISLLAKNLVSYCTCNLRGRLDVVPVDYVADAMIALMQEDASSGQTYHLTAGLGEEVTIGQVLEGAYEFAGVSRRPFIPFWLFMLLRKSPLARFFAKDFWYVADMAKPYYSYMRGVSARFDNRQTVARLERLGVQSVGWEAYKRSVFRYCIDSRWGKRLPQKEYLYYLPAKGAAKSS